MAQLYPQALSSHFSRLLQHAWATVGLFFSPVTTRGEVFMAVMLLLMIANERCKGRVGSNGTIFISSFVEVY
jgi:hypothetical protein